MICCALTGDSSRSCDCDCEECDRIHAREHFEELAELEASASGWGCIGDACILPDSFHTRDECLTEEMCADYDLEARAHEVVDREWQDPVALAQVLSAHLVEAGTNTARCTTLLRSALVALKSHMPWSQVLAAVEDAERQAEPLDERTLAELQAAMLEGLDDGWSPPAPGQGWRVIGTFDDGAAYEDMVTKMAVIVTRAREQDGRRWLHVSLSHPTRLPKYRELVAVKRWAIGDAKALEVHAPAAQHVNLHKYCRHLWHCLDGDSLPDFTHGMGSI